MGYLPRCIRVRSLLSVFLNLLHLKDIVIHSKTSLREKIHWILSDKDRFV